MPNNTPPSQHASTERSRGSASSSSDARNETRPYFGSLIIPALLWMLPALAVQWYAVSIDSGLYSRFSLVMAQAAFPLAAIGAVYRKVRTADRAVLDEDRHLTLWRQLRRVRWGPCAVGYLTLVVVAAVVFAAGAHGHTVAFPALSVCLVALHAAWTVPPLMQWLRQASPMVLLVVLGALAGLAFGGMHIHEYWIDDPWFWASAALVGLMLLRISWPRLVTRFRERLQRRGNRAK